MIEYVYGIVYMREVYVRYYITPAILYLLYAGKFWGP